MQAQEANLEAVSGGSFVLDTTFVLFFLAVDFGQSLTAGGLDSLFSGVTLALLVVLPYLLPSTGEKPSFGNWVLGRTLIATMAMLLGVIFDWSLGTVLPEVLRFLPLTLLIAAAMVTFYLQFYGMMRVRLAR